MPPKFFQATDLQQGQIQQRVVDSVYVFPNNQQTQLMKSSTASATPQSSPTSQMSVTCPTTLEEIPVTNISYNLTRENCNGVLMGSIMKRARAAQANWKELTFSERAQHIQSIKQQLITKKHEVAKAICLNAGKTPVDAMATEVLPAILGCDWYAANSEKHLKEER